MRNLVLQRCLGLAYVSSKWNLLSSEEQKSRMEKLSDDDLLDLLVDLLELEQFGND